MKRLILLGLFAPMLGVGAAEARDPGHSCFLQKNGRTMDLSVALCGNKPLSEAEMKANFLAELKWKVAYAPRGEALLPALEKRTEVFVNEAKAYCLARKQGASDRQILEVQRKALPRGMDQASLKAVMSLVKTNNELAVKHFCPELL